MPDEDSVESYELGGAERISAAETDWVGQTFGQEGIRGAYQVSYSNLEQLESRRLIADVPTREAAQRLVTGVGRAEEVHRERTSRARTVDEQKKAPMTTSFETWAANPRRWDYPGVDDPRTQGPKASGIERFRYQMKKDPDNIAINTPGPDVVDYRDLEDGGRPPPGAANVPRDTTPGVGSIERDDEAAWERGSPGVGTLEMDDSATWEDGDDVTGRDEYGRADWGLPPLEQMVGQKDTDELLALREQKFERHSKARKLQKAKGRTAGRETIEDDMMRGYLSDIRTIEDELYERGAMG